MAACRQDERDVDPLNPETFAVRNDMAMDVDTVDVVLTQRQSCQSCTLREKRPRGSGGRSGSGGRW